jgi:hypothetical protein
MYVKFEEELTASSILARSFRSIGPILRASTVRWPIVIVIGLTVVSACGLSIYRLIPDEGATGLNPNRMERLHNTQEEIHVEVTGFLHGGKRGGTTAKLVLKIVNTSNETLRFDPNEMSLSVDETEFMTCHALVASKLDPRHADVQTSDHHALDPRAQAPIIIGSRVTEYINLSIGQECLPTLPHRLAVRFAVVREINPVLRLYFERTFRVLRRGSEA